VRPVKSGAAASTAEAGAEPKARKVALAEAVELGVGPAMHYHP